MKILHTSDWHLGKKLEGVKRTDEQKKFINTLEKIVENENPKLILIAGDIFDNPNPSSEAETLFFDALKKISNFGKRAIVIIPGNHDSSERLSACKNFAKDFGIIIYEKPFEKKDIGIYGEFTIEKSTDGGILLNIEDEKIFLYSLPYPSEYSLNEIFDENDDVTFSKKIGEILTKGIDINVDKSIPKIIMSHLFILGSISDGDEKNIELGGSRSVSLDDLPEADYIALGHIHKPMKFIRKRACYSGSPLEYRVSENKYSKKIILADVKGNFNTQINEISLENYKPIKKYEVFGSEEAIELSHNLLNKDEWIYLKIYSDNYLSNSDIREIKKNKNILEISCVSTKSNENNLNDEIDYSELNIKDAFIEYYKSFDGTEPNKDVLDLFVKFLGEDVE